MLPRRIHPIAVITIYHIFSRGSTFFGTKFCILSHFLERLPCDKEKPFLVDMIAYNLRSWRKLKSSAKVIGAEELSNRARALELAATSGDLTYIHEHTGDVLSFYGSYKKKLEGI